MNLQNFNRDDRFENDSFDLEADDRHMTQQLQEIFPDPSIDQVNDAVNSSITIEDAVDIIMKEDDHSKETKETGKHIRILFL